jgi:hypothetical protein
MLLNIKSNFPLILLVLSINTIIQYSGNYNGFISVSILNPIAYLIDIIISLLLISFGILVNINSFNDVP